MVQYGGIRRSRGPCRWRTHRILYGRSRTAVSCGLSEIWLAIYIRRSFSRRSCCSGTVAGILYYGRSLWQFPVYWKHRAHFLWENVEGTLYEYGTFHTFARKPWTVFAGGNAEFPSAPYAVLQKFCPACDNSGDSCGRHLTSARL